MSSDSLIKDIENRFFADPCIKVGEGRMTMDEALATSRALATSGPRTIEIVGDITLMSPIELSEKDNGLTIRGGRISGGVVLDKWERDPRDDRFLRARLPEGAMPRMLIVDGRAQKLSVYPCNSFLEHKDEPLDLRWLNSANGGWNRPPSVHELTHVHVDPEDIPIGLVAGSTEIRIYHSWDESTVPIKSFDRTSGEITLASSLTHPAGSFDKRVFQLINIREGMTDLGCWYFDADEGYIYYYPERGAEDFHAVIPLVNTLIKINGASNITLMDIELSHCGSERVSSGLRSANLGGCVDIVDSSRIMLYSLKIHDSAGHGIKIVGSSAHRTLRCEIFNMGGGGIFTHACSEEEIRENNVRDIGLIAYSSVGIHAGGRSMLVWVLDGKPEERGTTLILGNRIERCPYCAITCNGEGHIIENNEVIDFMQRLSDGAGIYVSRGREVIVRRNYARASLVGRPNKSYYFDEGGYKCVCEENQSLGVESAYGDHRCRKMTVRKNHFESPGVLYLVFNNCRDYKIEENELIAGARLVIAVPQDGIESVKSLVEFLKLHFHFRKNKLTAESPVPFVVGYGEQIEASRIKIN